MNNVVEEVGKMNFTGNIIPQAWYSTLKRESGKPYLTAIVILADIVYWYRPIEVRDEQTGQVIEYRKKFRSDKLQRSYQQIADMFGISKNEATQAIIYLEKKGIVYREFREISINGVISNNVLFIGLNPNKLREVTFIDTKTLTPPNFKMERGLSENGEVWVESGGTYTEINAESSFSSPHKEPQEFFVSKDRQGTNPQEYFFTHWNISTDDLTGREVGAFSYMNFDKLNAAMEKSKSFLQTQHIARYSHFYIKNYKKIIAGYYDDDKHEPSKGKNTSEPTKHLYDMEAIKAEDRSGGLF